jgi:hypothetical protein
MIVAMLALLWIAALPARAVAAVWPVSDLMKLQETVDNAVYGDTVLVAPGQYRTVIPRSGIKLLSQKGPQETIFKYSGRRLVDADGVDSLATVEGFTIDGLKGAEGVVYARESQFTIRNCVIRGGWSGIYSEYSDLRIENCTIRDCQTGLFIAESAGSVINSDIQLCFTGITLVSATPRIYRTTVTRNSLGIYVKEHSDPQIGGTLATANRIWNNAAGAVRSELLGKNEGVRSLKPAILKVPFNFWGSDCPDSSLFRGKVEWKPWVDESGAHSLEKCPPSSQPRK